MPTQLSTPTSTFEHVAFDPYAVIHKTIRSVLFGTTVEIGRTDPASDAARREVAARVESAIGVLETHARHEDTHAQPTIMAELPHLGERIADDHATLGRRTELLRGLAADASGSRDPRRDLHRLYVEFASFTSAYLAHQDFEERVVMPATERAIGVDAVVAIHDAITADLSPQERVDGFALMLPVINVDERVELMTEIRRDAVDEEFAGICALAASVLGEEPYRKLVDRLELV